MNGVDILIDDGGQTVEEQRITLEEMLRHLRGEECICARTSTEGFNRFGFFAACLVNALNEVEILSESPVLTSAVSHFQRSSHSIHFYPYVMVIEKNDAPATKLSASRHGSQWRPFL